MMRSESVMLKDSASLDVKYASMVGVKVEPINSTIFETGRKSNVGGRMA